MLHKDTFPGVPLGIWKPIPMKYKGKAYNQAPNVGKVSVNFNII